MAILYFKHKTKDNQDLVKNGYVVNMKKVSSIYDYSFVFDEIKYYETRGWNLHSHNFSTTKSMDTGYIGEERISHFLLTR